MKRFVCLILTVAIVIGLMAGCGKTKSKSTTTPAETTATNSGGEKTTTGSEEAKNTVASKEPPNLKGKTITIMTTDTWVAGLTLSDVLPRFKQIEARTGCTIVWETVATDYSPVLQPRLTGNSSDCPDIVLLGGTSMVQIAKYIDEGLLYDITKAYDVCPNIKKFWEVDRPDLKGIFVYHDGGIYNLLANVYDTPDGMANNVSLNGDNAVWYRADIAKELGFNSYPKTINELYEMLSAVHKKYPDMVPMHMWDWSCWESARVFTSAYGLHFNNEQSNQFFYADKNGKVQYEPALDATLEWLTEMNKWYKEGLIVVGASEDQKIGAAAQGITFSGFYSGVTGMCEAQLKAIKPDAYFLYMPFPTAEGHELTFMGRAAYGNSYAVIDNGDEEQCRAALQFLDYAFFSDYGKFSEKAGVEGEGWSFGSNGEFVPNKDYIRKILNKEVVLQASGANIHFNGPTVSSYEVNSIWDKVNKEVKAEMGYVDPMNKEQQANWKEINAVNTAAYCPYFPNFFMSAEDQDNVNTLSGDLITFTNEMMEKYILGTADLSKFKTEFVDVLYKDLHLQEVLDIYQKYYNIYLKNSKGS